MAPEPWQSAVSKSCDGKALSKLAEKVPAIKQSGNVTLITMRVIERDALVKIIDALVKHPEWGLPMRGILHSQDFITIAQEASASSSKKGEWSSNCDTVKAMPKAWKLNLLEKTSNQSSDLLSKVDHEDLEGIEILFAFEMKLKSRTLLSNVCQDHVICTSVSIQRTELKGFRVAKLFARHGISTKGVIDHSKLCYTPNFDESGDCKSLGHCQGATVNIPRHTPMARKFSLNNNIFDMDAYMELVPAMLPLHQLFDLDSNVHAHKLTNNKGESFRDVAEGVTEGITQKQTAAKELSVYVSPSTSLTTVEKERSNNRIQSASQKLQERAQERASNRRVTLS